MQEVRGRAGRRGAGLPAQGAAPRTVATAVVAVRASGPPPHGRRAPRPRSGIGPRPRSRARIVGLGSAPPAGQTPTPAGRRARARGPLRAGRPSGAARGPRLPMVRRGSRCGRRCEGIEAPRPGNPSPAEALDSGIPPPRLPSPTHPAWTPTASSACSRAPSSPRELAGPEGAKSILATQRKATTGRHQNSASSRKPSVIR